MKFHKYKSGRGTLQVVKIEHIHNGEKSAFYGILAIRRNNYETFRGTLPKSRYFDAVRAQNALDERADSQDYKWVGFTERIPVYRGDYGEFNRVRGNKENSNDKD